jgi:hypothetical protein
MSLTFLYYAVTSGAKNEEETGPQAAYGFLQKDSDVFYLLSTRISQEERVVAQH